MFYGGDEVRLTGREVGAAGRMWLEAEILDGHKAGTLIVMPKPEDKQADIEKSRSDWREQQAEFRNLQSTTTQEV